MLLAAATHAELARWCLVSGPSCTGRPLRHSVAAAMEAFLSGRPTNYFGFLGLDAGMVEVKIHRSREWPVKEAETKQIDNFQLNLDEVSTEPTGSTAPLKRLSYASLELWPLLRLPTALVSLGSARSLFLPTSLVTAAGSTCQQPARDILRHQVAGDELPRHCRCSQRAEKHAPTTDDVHIDEGAVTVCRLQLLSHRTAAPLEMG